MTSQNSPPEKKWMERLLEWQCKRQLILIHPHRMSSFRHATSFRIISAPHPEASRHRHSPVLFFSRPEAEGAWAREEMQPRVKQQKKIIRSWSPHKWWTNLENVMKSSNFCKYYMYIFSNRVKWADAACNVDGIIEDFEVRDFSFSYPNPLIRTCSAHLTLHLFS